MRWEPGFVSPNPTERNLMDAKRNIAARAARWSAAHRKIAIFGWIAFVVASVVLGGAIGTKQLTNAEAGAGDSGKAELALEKAGLTPNDEMVMVQSQKLKAGDPAFDAAVDEATRKLSALPSVTAVSSPADGGGQVSADGHTALVEFQIPGNEDQAEERVDASLAATAAVQKAHPDLRVEQFGGASAGKALEEVFSEDLSKAETTSLPLTLFILLLAFGALVAALVPLLIGFSAVLATVSLLALPSQLVPMDQNVASVVVLVGLAVGVDYSLFYMRREREERRAGRSASAALEAAAATSGRAVLVSGLTVIAAMAGMLISGDPTFTSFAVGTMTVVAVAMFASISVLPAVLSKLGDKVERGRIPFVARLRRGRSGRSVWSAVVERVMRRPALSLAVSAALLIALAVPAISMQTKVSGAEDLPRDIPVVQTYNRITAAFPGEAAGATVVVEADDVSSGPVAAAIDELVRSAEADPQVSGKVDVEVSRDGTVAAVQIPTVGSGSDAAATRAMEQIRDQLVPAAFAGSGAEVNVGGQAAESKDFNDRLAERLPLVFAFVLGLAFLLMLVTFRSIVVPIKAILLNLLSVGAAYGVLVLVFQNGLGESLLGFHSNGGVSSWLPMFLFVILFGLSMDYHVLILSRVREYVDRGMKTEEAVQRGITATAGTVTSAAVVMVAVFSVFATLSILDMKEMGIGLAVAVLIDATIVRAVMLPAAMKLLGERNWYLPRFLSWLPRLREPEPEAGTA
ncbi:MAG TPA: MMPL family transporter [Solirubrobacterales bacterium]|nr:MMPL family transporter [Solirubrobacterales bacterium]